MSTATQLLQQPTALSVVKEFGTHKSSVRFMSLNVWKIPDDYRALFDEYYLLYWTGAYLKTQNINGTIKGYTVQYKRCTPVEVYAAPQVALSFRKPLPEFGLSGIVIVSIRRNNQGEAI